MKRCWVKVSRKILNQSNIHSVLLIGNHLSNHGQNPSPGEVLAPKLKSLGWDVFMVSNKKSKILRLLDFIFTIISKRELYAFAQVDVFSGEAFIWAYLSGSILRLLKKPFILSLHGGDLPRFAKKYPSVIKSLLNKTNHVTSPSSYLINELRWLHSDIQLIPNGIEVSSYPYDLRKNVGPKLLWLRSFHSIYNPTLIPRVMSSLKENNIKIDILMIGPDKADGSLKATIDTAARLGVQDSIEIILGVPKTNVPRMLARGDIFINTTNVDNTPISVLEAMACGLPVVSTNVGGIPYLIEDGEDGLLVPPDDPMAMAGAIRRILIEPGLAGKLSQNARQKAEKFDWSNILPMWDEVFKAMIPD
jgi:glycosyltransferase involved in cell wall biosynthesis